MEGVASEKVVGGKLVRVKVTYDDVITDVKITGDFFLHPEEKIEDIEKSLFGVKVNADEKVFVEIINDVVKENNIELIGVTPEAIAKVIKEAIK